MSDGPAIDLGYLAFDADNHYYEAPDAFTATSNRDSGNAPCNGPRSTASSDSSSPAR